MNRIKLLDINTSNKIAAGEVVERPFSVVKELVENSIDAGASNIIVEIEEGGQKLIKVIDNGTGIHPDDVKIAFSPHATSKISDVDDIYKINTLGFRGEALASIASVSEVTIKTKVDSNDLGKELHIKYGDILKNIDAGMDTGTTIFVQNLFSNVPARLKFMKSTNREAALISDILNRLALSNNNISFKLINNGKTSVNTFASSDLSNVIRNIYGKNIYENITYVEKYSDTVSVHGYIGNSEISRGSRNNQSIFVNNRYIKSKLITAAVENAYKSFLTINKFPYFVLFIDIYPELIDVNIHPTKSEIKFNNEREIFKIVFDCVHEGLKNSMKDYFDVKISSEVEKENIKQEEKKDEISFFQIPVDLKSNYPMDAHKQDTPEVNFEIRESIATGNDKQIGSKEEHHFREESKKINGDTKDKIIDDNRSEVIEPKFPELNIIGQFNSTYILSQYMGELYIIDQHAAHEKILFEKYKKQIKNNQVVSQVLLNPMIIELSSEDYIDYIENEQDFTKVGFLINDFGNNAISIREVPMIFGKSDFKALFMSILNNIKKSKTNEISDLKFNQIALNACKTAIKANERLDIKEMVSLIEELRFIDEPFTCPHGRPTIIKISVDELEKRFKRKL